MAVKVWDSWLGSTWLNQMMEGGDVDDVPRLSLEVNITIRHVEVNLITDGLDSILRQPECSWEAEYTELGRENGKSWWYDPKVSTSKPSFSSLSSMVSDLLIKTSKITNCNYLRVNSTLLQVLPGWPIMDICFWKMVNIKYGKYLNMYSIPT